MTENTQTVTVFEAYWLSLWELGTLSLLMNERHYPIVDISRGGGIYHLHITERDGSAGSVESRAGDWLDYTPLPAAAFVPNGAAIERQNIADTFATPDPQAEIAALRAERDAANLKLLRVEHQVFEHGNADLQARVVAIIHDGKRT